ARTQPPLATSISPGADRLQGTDEPARRHDRRRTAQGRRFVGTENCRAGSVYCTRLLVVWSWALDFGPWAGPNLRPKAQDRRPKTQGQGTNVMSLDTGRYQLHAATKSLRERWEATEETWRDAIRRQFAEDYWEPLELRVQSALSAIERLAQVMARA